MRPIDADKVIFDIKSSNNMDENNPTWRSKDVVILLENAPELPNDPLTPEQMREMGGEPYCYVGLQDDSTSPQWNILDPFYAKYTEDYGYGKRWIAYRYKHEET